MPAAATIEDSTVIEAHDLALKKEQNDEWYVGREDLGRFIALPEIWAQAVIYMSIKSPLTHQYPTFGAVKHFIRTKSRDDDAFHAEIDNELRLLITQLRNHQIIRAIGGEVYDERAEPKDMLPSIHTHHVAWFFSPPSLVLQAALIGGTLAWMFLTPDIRPRLSHYFWTPAPGLSLLTGFASAWVLTFLHELFHVFAARSARLRSSLVISRRMMVLPIFEAQTWNLLKAPTSKRVLVRAAGILSDLLVTSVLALLLALALRGTVPWPGWAVAIVRQLILLRLLGVAWQFLLVFRTDATATLQYLLGDASLQTKADAYLKELWHAVRHPLQRGRHQHLQDRHWPEAAARTKWFLAAMLGSAVLLVPFFVRVLFDVYLELLRRAGSGLLSVGTNPAAAFDGLLVLVIYGFMVWLAMRARVRAR